MKRILILRFGLLTFIALFSGCATEDRRDASSMCEVHHVQMRCVKIPLVVGWVDHFSEEYSRAYGTLFPNCYPEGPTSNWKRERVYVCDRCVDAKKAWSQAQKSKVSNHRPALDCSMTTRLQTESRWLAASEAERWAWERRAVMQL